MNNVIIRGYQHTDREAVRQISGDTANLGQPVETFFRDREVMVDLLMNYYTDYEPKSFLVAEQEGIVVGYLCGCLHHNRYRFLTFSYILPKTLLRAFFRGVFGQKETWRLIKASLTTLFKGGYIKKIPMDQYPVHMHINLRTDFRNRHIGQYLMEHFCQQIKTLGFKGIHAVTREKNKGACRFFEKMGFVSLSQHILVMPSMEGQIYDHTVVYGKSL